MNAPGERSDIDESVGLVFRSGIIDSIGQDQSAFSICVVHFD